MTTLLPILHLFALILTWKSEPDLTYTAQVSGDLQAWETLPFIMAGDGLLQSLEIDDPRNPVFARLRYSDTGDTNENGLPDLWEWEAFGSIDINPDADPDRDGVSNYMEWVAGTDPLDFFDGETPVIRLSSGREWIIAAGQPSAQALVVSLYHASGEPWAGAPVLMESVSGLAGLLTGGQSPMEATHLLTAWTDTLGRLQPGMEAIHVLAPESPGQRDTIQISAGPATAQLLVRSTGPEYGPPPRELQLDVAHDGSTRLTWSGDPGEAIRFILEESDVAGNWRQVLSVAALDLPEANPETGRYELILE